MDIEMKNRGVLEQPASPKHWMAGWVTGLPDTVLVPNGDWRSYLPKAERQSVPGSYDTMSCVTFAALNTLEILHIHAYGEEPNWSDRFTAKMSGTTKQGNWFSRVWDSIRNDGLVNEPRWPFQGATWEEYMSDIPADVSDEAKAFHSAYDVGYEFIPIVKPETLRRSLQRAPIQVSIGVTEQFHSVTLVYLDTDGTRWIFDHYTNALYVLPPNFQIFGALRPYLARKSNKPMPLLKLPENCLVSEGEGHGRRGLHVAGKLFIGTEHDLAQWILRNEKDGQFAGGPVRTISTKQFDSFPQVTFKKEPLN